MTRASHPSSAEARALIGQTLGGRYTLVRLLGQGTRGLTYLARQSEMPHEVVVKVLMLKSGADTHALARLALEAERVRGVQHPNIVALLDHGHDPDHGAVYLVTEYVVGESLADYLHRKGRLGIEAFVPIAAQVLKAMGHAHARELRVHDVEPAHIMLCERKGRANFVKLLGLGLADPGISERAITEEHALGPVGYLAPEVLAGDAVDLRADVYAIGALFYRMLGGRLPFVDETDAGVLYKTLNEVPPHLGELVDADAGISSRLLDLIHACLQKDRNRRPADADRVVEALIDVVPASLFRLPPSGRESGTPLPVAHGNSGLLELMDGRPNASSTSLGARLGDSGLRAAARPPPGPRLPAPPPLRKAPTLPPPSAPRSAMVRPGESETPSTPVTGQPTEAANSAVTPRPSRKTRGYGFDTLSSPDTDLADRPASTPGVPRPVAESRSTPLSSPAATAGKSARSSSTPLPSTGAVPMAGSSSPGMTAGGSVPSPSATSQTLPAPRPPVDVHAPKVHAVSAGPAWPSERPEHYPGLTSLLEGSGAESSPIGWPRPAGSLQPGASTAGLRGPKGLKGWWLPASVAGATLVAAVGIGALLINDHTPRSPTDPLQTAPAGLVDPTPTSDDLGPQLDRVRALIDGGELDRATTTLQALRSQTASGSDTAQHLDELDQLDQRIRGARLRATARATEAAGDRAGALTAYRQLLHAVPGDPEAEQALARLSAPTLEHPPAGAAPKPGANLGPTAPVLDRGPAEAPAATPATPRVAGTGPVQITSRPIADLMIDGAPAGTTPFSGALPLGRHHVRLVARGYQSWETTIEVTESANLPLSITLRGKEPTAAAATGERPSAPRPARSQPADEPDGNSEPAAKQTSPQDLFLPTQKSTPDRVFLPTGKPK